MILGDDHSQAVLEASIGERNLAGRRRGETERRGKAQRRQSPERSRHSPLLLIDGDLRPVLQRAHKRHASPQPRGKNSRIRRTRTVEANGRASWKERRGSRTKTCGRPETEREAPCESADGLSTDASAGPARHGPCDPPPICRRTESTIAETRTGGGAPRRGQAL